jgi:nitrate reductase NapE component
MKTYTAFSLMLLYLLVVVGFLGVIGYVVWHFVAKYW